MSHHARSLAFALVLLAAGLPASMASAAQFPVNDTGDVPLDPTAPPCVCRIAPRSTRCTLRAAIQAANACVGHDVIQIQPLGHYDLTIAGAGESLGQTGDLDIREGVTIQGNGVWVSQHAQDRVFDVAIFGGGGQIERTTFSSNVAVARGGAIVVHVLPGGGSAPLAIDDSTFYQNRTDGAGGALSVRTDSVVARHVTFDSNTAVTSGAAIEVVAPVSVCSSLFTTSVTSGPDQCSAPVSTGYTVSTDFSCLAASGDQLVFNAGVGAFANHGGPTSTVELLANSPAIDAGDPATCSAVDQRGEARPAGACDAGAFERE